MTTITDNAASATRESNKAVGRLMDLFDKTQVTIWSWLEAKDIRLTTPDAVRIIGEETGLEDSQILEEDTVKVGE